MLNDSAKLATLVGSRLCHDLVSPVGAISNGLELIALSGAPGSDEIDLIEQSCTSAAARINFFRVAFGYASPQQMVGAREARKLLTRLSEGTRLSADWQPDEDIPRPQVQLAFLAYLCCESALPQGGRVQIERTGQGWRITGSGPRITLEPAIWEQFNSESVVPDLPPARVQFACLANLAPAQGLTVSVAAGEAAVTIMLI